MCLKYYSCACKILTYLFSHDILHIDSSFQVEWMRHAMSYNRWFQCYDRLSIFQCVQHFQLNIDNRAVHARMWRRKAEKHKAINSEFDVDISTRTAYLSLFHVLYENAAQLVHTLNVSSFASAAKCTLINSTDGERTCRDVLVFRLLRLAVVRIPIFNFVSSHTRKRQKMRLLSMI